MIPDAILADLPRSEGDFAPCFAFSVHKCGSSMLHAMIAQVSAAAGIPAVSIPDRMFREGISDGSWQDKAALGPLFARRWLHYGFRQLPALLLADPSLLAGRRFVLLVRDPRDALVSQYFSFGRGASSSHVAPAHNPEAFLAQIAATPDHGIDAYVLGEAANLRGKLEAYRDGLDFAQGLVCRYEEAYFDKLSLLRAVFSHFGIAVDDAILAAAAAAQDIRPAVEDESRHIRQGAPGDHARKLGPATIAALDDCFREIGAFYGYRL